MLLAPTVGWRRFWCYVVGSNKRGREVLVYVVGSNSGVPKVLVYVVGFNSDGTRAFDVYCWF